jgi:hypothetical protein
MNFIRRVKSYILEWFAKECCCNCKFCGEKNKYRYFILNTPMFQYPSEATDVAGVLCNKDTYLHLEYDKCELWEKEL